jgi:hypothetical protein
MLTLLNLTFSQTLNYPFYFGGTDILDHISWSQFIVVSGKIAPVEYAGFYNFFPLFHIYNAIGTLFTGTEIKILYFLLNGIIFCLGILFLYLIFKNSMFHEQIALLGCLLFSTSAVTIYFGTYMITRSIALIGFLFILYLYLKLIRNQKFVLQFFVLLLICFVFLLLVHHVSILQILPLFALLIICSAIINSETKQNFKVLIVFIFIAVCYWFYIAWTLLKDLIQQRLDLQFYDHVALSPSWGIENKIVADTLFGTLNYIKSYFDIGLFIFFYFIGVSYILYKKKPAYGLIFSIITIITLPFYIPTPLQSIWQLSFTMGFDRLQLIVEPFMAIMMAFGVYIIVKYTNTINKNKYFILVLAIFFLFSFFSNISIVNAGDSLDLFPNPPSSTHFDKVDLATFSFLNSYLNSGSKISSDTNREVYLGDLSFVGWEQYNIKHFTVFSIHDLNDITNEDSYFLYPKDEFDNRGALVFYNTVFKFSEQNANFLEMLLNDQNKIYSSQSNELYYSR